MFYDIVIFYFYHIYFMKEDILHFIWKYKKFKFIDLKTTQNESIIIKSFGSHNTTASGPDFLNAQIKIGDQLWAGNVEIHVKSSDWFLHNHENDSAYDNVILHVVWEHDVDVFRNDNTSIPTLIIKDRLSSEILKNYDVLFLNEKKWISCEDHFSKIDNFIFDNWLERLYFQRLEQKSKVIESLLEASKNDWEMTLFRMLFKNFGLKVNGASFFSLAQAIDFSTVKKLYHSQQNLEALFFGMSGLLEEEIPNSYYNALLKEFKFLQQKFQLNNDTVIPIQFFRLRPSNFPTIRLSQLASLYSKHKSCLLYTSPSPRDGATSRMPSSA